MLTIEDCEYDISLISDILDRHWGNLHDHVVHDPITCCADGRAPLSESQWQNLCWVNPDGCLEANCESALEDEEHCGRRNTSTMSTSGVVLNLVNETSLDCHHDRHQGDHGEQ